MQYIYSMKETCSKCQQRLEDSRVNKQRYCKKCHAENMRKTRPKHSELKPEQKLKANARSMLNVYVKRGKITKQSCVICNDNNSQAHHEDYNKPLDVIWLCRPCHLKHHNQTLD